MPDSLLFDNVNDYISLSPGAVDGTGAWTFLVIMKPTTNPAAFRDILGWNAVDQGFGISNAATPTLLWFPNSGPSTSTVTLDTANNWQIVGLSKPDGVSGCRYHRYIYDTTTWTHSNETGAAATEFPACTRMIINSQGNLGTFYGANYLVAAFWDSQLSDVTIETMTTTQQSWVDAAPDEAWRFDTMSSITAFVGTSTENTRVGTTLDAGDAPTGWTDITPDQGSADLAWLVA